MFYSNKSICVTLSNYADVVQVCHLLSALGAEIISHLHNLRVLILARRALHHETRINFLFGGDHLMKANEAREVNLGDNQWASWAYRTIAIKLLEMQVKVELISGWNR